MPGTKGEMKNNPIQIEDEKRKKEKKERPAAFIKTFPPVSFHLLFNQLFSFVHSSSPESQDETWPFLSFVVVIVRV